jgi:hypothetical protein
MASSQVANIFESTHSILGVMDEVINKPEMGIPKMFLRPDKEPSILSNETNPLQSIPVFDFQTLICGDNTELDKLFSACKDWGFFQVYKLEFNSCSSIA